MKVLIHLHIYYEKQAASLLRKISQAASGTDCHLVVTIWNNHPKREWLQNQINTYAPKAEICWVPNIGYDIYPFIYVLQNRNLKEYDYILKLHTKSRRSASKTYLNGDFFSDRQWTDSLLFALVGSEANFQKAIQVLDRNPQCGMVGADSCIVTEYPYIREINKELEKLGLPSVSLLQFVAGTMFLVRAELMQPLTRYCSEDFGTQFTGAKDGTFSHMMERMFAAVVMASGLTVQGVPSDPHPLLSKPRKCMRRVWNSFVRIASRVVSRIKRKRRLKMIRESELFDAEWYSATYLKPRGIQQDPAEHYLLLGGFCGFDPSKAFSSSGYYRCNPDIEWKGKNPLVHYLLHGMEEGRSDKNVIVVMDAK